MRLTRVLVLLLLVTSGLHCNGCPGAKKSLNKVVLIEYDRVNNFRAYDFGAPIVWMANGQRQSGINGFALQGADAIHGFWVTFLICSLRNERPEAAVFNYDASKFYVEYNGEQFFYEPMKPYTFESRSQGIPANPLATANANEAFREETQIGENTDAFLPGYYPNLNYRISIYVTRTQPDGPLNVGEQLDLRYDGYPNITSARNQPPKVLNPTTRDDLRTICRPPA